MKIDYEALAKEYEYLNSPKRWKNLVIVSLVIMTIVIAVLVVLSIADSDMRSSIDLFLARNYKYVFGGVGVVLVLSIAQTFSNTQKDKQRIKEYKVRLNEYKAKAADTLENVKPIARAKIDKFKKNNDWFNEDYEYFYWQDQESIHFFPCPPVSAQNSRIYGFSKKKADIKYYEMVGEKFYENKISGGGSEGPNIGGAIIGAQLGGTAGAIIGGQQTIKPIESELILHDTRKLLMIFSLDDGVSEIICNSEFFGVLKVNLPEKSKEIYEEIAKHKVLGNA
ncbi:MAG: hypothetical protein PHZ28_06205, partial [Candidatus Izemoplasmatales bacterium]|nr:hypothetical protein [Candidatus Izemoplasmatales bacterium]